ncbi:MAG TPA: Hpt domain-containing protein [Bacteriovoracaceae bacterium]|nr:Hpt domain-containing protein [Bacteriovoracaceae bacterium]
MRKLSDPTTEVPLPGLESYHDEFLASRKGELSVLKEAMKTKDFKVLSLMAHKWKGFSAPYGFQELERLSLSLEKCAEDEQNDQCNELLMKIEAYLG